jgi:hypothetical protein
MKTTEQSKDMSNAQELDPTRYNPELEYFSETITGCKPIRDFFEIEYGGVAYIFRRPYLKMSQK